MTDTDSDPELVDLFAGFGLDGASPTAVLKAAATASRRCKGAKVFPIEDGIVVAVQDVVAVPDCLPDPTHLAGVLPRMLSMLAYAVEKFRTELELAGIAEASGADAE